MKFRSLKKSAAFAAAALFATLALGGAHFAGIFAARSAAAYAADGGSFPYDGKNLIVNGDFNSFSGAFPKNPSNWSGSGPSSVRAGVVSLLPSDYNANRDNYKLPEGARLPEYNDSFLVPGGDSARNVLMINASDSRAVYSYTSDEISLGAHKRYMFEVYVTTLDYTDGGAAIRLLDSATGDVVGRSADKTVSADKAYEKALRFRDVEENSDGNGNTVWASYALYVETSYYPVKVKLSLQSGDVNAPATGAAFFNAASAKTVSPADFAAARVGGNARTRAYSFGNKSGAVTPAGDAQTEFIDLTDKSVLGGGDKTAGDAYGGHNPLFKDTATDLSPEGWTTLRGGAGSGDSADETASYTVPYASTVPSNTHEFVTPSGASSPSVLKFRHEDGSPAASGVRSAPLTIERYRCYRISVWYKTDEKAKVYIALTEIDNASTGKRKVTVKTEELSTAGDKGNADMRNWNQANFFIKGDSSDIRALSVELWLGYGGKNETDTHSTGEAYFYGLEAEYLTSAEYDRYSGSGDNTVSVPGGLNANLAPGDNSTVTNGYFTQYGYDEFALPFKPKDWTYFGGGDTGVISNAPDASDFNYSDGDVTRGIVPADKNFYDALRARKDAGDTDDVLAKNISFEANLPEGAARYGKNLLMLKNAVKSASGYKSSEITVSADNYLKISVYAASSYSEDAESGAALALLRDGRIIAVIEDIKTGGEWRSYSFVAAGGAEQTSLSLLLLNGRAEGRNPLGKLAAGTVFFSRADTANATENDFKTARDNPGDTRAVDLKSTFGLFEHNADSAVKFPYSFTGQAAAGRENSTIAGVLDLNDIKQTGASASDEAIYEHGINDPGSASGERYVLMIKNVSPTGYSFISDKSYTMNANSYYKVTASVKTEGVDADPNFERKDKAKPGAFISLSGIEGASFAGINTELRDAKDAVLTNEYATYTFYVQTGGSELKFKFELGLGDPLKEATWCSGFAYFDSIKSESVSKNEFDKNDKEIKNKNVATKLSLSFATQSEDETKTGGKSYWEWYWLPSLLFGLALVWVLIAAALRYFVPSLRRRRARALEAARGGGHAAKKPQAARLAPSKDAVKVTEAYDEETYIDVDDGRRNYIYRPDGMDKDADKASIAEVAAADDAPAAVTAEAVTAEAVPAKVDAAETAARRKKGVKKSGANKVKEKDDYIDYFED